MINDIFKGNECNQDKIRIGKYPRASYLQGGS